jgi:transposase
MSKKELSRLEVVCRVFERRLTQREASKMLGVGLRQMERLCRAYRESGAEGLVSRKRGRPSNRAFPRELRPLLGFRPYFGC